MRHAHTLRTVAIVGLVIATHATAVLGAADYLLAGKKLVIRDSTTKKLVFITKDPATITPTPGGADDPTLVGADFALKTSSGETAQFALPATGWFLKQTSDGPLFKFVNEDAPGGLSPVRVVVLRGGFLKVKALDSGISLNEGSQVAIGVRLTAGGCRWCSAFATVESIVVDDPGLFKASGDFPPAGCISPSGAFIE